MTAPALSQKRLQQVASSDILRFATAGSVDDGKSSLIGRLLYDSRSIMEDQLLAIQNATKRRGGDHLELALLTDGLRAEREQNITIDVAYRYFSTPKRKFIVADTPGHVQYTRNMVTGTSTADVSVILIDARNGVLTQSKRHAAISSLLGVKALAVAINKMDLVGFDRGRFLEIQAEFTLFAQKLGNQRHQFLPISALLGDNVVEPSRNMPWYEGPTLLSFLEDIEIPSSASLSFRMPVQYVVRPHQDFRGLAGQIESGTIRAGDQVRAGAGARRATVQSLYVSGQPAETAQAGDAALIALSEDLDVGRGDLLFTEDDLPTTADRIDAILCWMHEQPLKTGKRYLLLHTTHKVSAVVRNVVHRVDVDSLAPLEAEELHMNDIGRVSLHTASPLLFDPYHQSRATGSFILVDPGTNVTVAAGMIQAAETAPEQGGTPQGRVVQLRDQGSTTDAIVDELREFGLNPILLRGSDNQILGLTLSEQGFDVLIAVPSNEIPIKSLEDLLAQLDQVRGTEAGAFI